MSSVKKLGYFYSWKGEIISKEMTTKFHTCCRYHFQEKHYYI